MSRALALLVLILLTESATPAHQKETPSNDDLPQCHYTGALHDADLCGKPSWAA
jgi:hypothetical protein